MKVWKVFLGGGLTVLILGIAVFLIGFALNGWKLEVKYEMLTFNSQEENTALDLNLSAGEMNVEFYDGDNIEVTYPDSYRYGFKVYENNGKLTVTPKIGFGIWFGWNKIPAVTVKIPQGKVMDLNIDISAGMITVADGEFTSVKSDMSAGWTNLGKLKCGKFISHISAGKLDVSSIDCTDFDLHLSAGAANLDRLKCDYIKVNLSAGSATFNVVGNENDYAIRVDKSAGSCNLSERLPAPGSTTDYKIIDIHLSAGSVNVGWTSN